MINIITYNGIDNLSINVPDKISKNIPKVDLLNKFNL